MKIFSSRAVAGFALAVGFSTAAMATPVTIDFEAGPVGPQPNGFTATGFSGVTFSDTIGAELRVGSGTACFFTGYCLGVLDNDASMLKINFAFDITSLSLAFGGDDPHFGFITNRDRAWLQAFDDGTLVAEASVTPNLDVYVNQTISVTAAAFDEALFYYADESGNPITMDELVDNITYETAVPEPASIALFGAGLVGLGLIRRRKAA